MKLSFRELEILQDSLGKYIADWGTGEQWDQEGREIAVLLKKKIDRALQSGGDK